MNDLKEYKETIFEYIKHIDELGREYWFARELMPLLEYRKWERFSSIIEKAKIACKVSENDINDHFPDAGKLIKLVKGITKQRIDKKRSLL